MLITFAFINPLWKFHFPVFLHTYIGINVRARGLHCSRAPRCCQEVELALLQLPVHTNEICLDGNKLFFMSASKICKMFFRLNSPMTVCLSGSSMSIMGWVLCLLICPNQTLILHVRGMFFHFWLKQYFMKRSYTSMKTNARREDALNYKCDINYVVEEMVFGILESYGKVK